MMTNYLYVKHLKSKLVQFRYTTRNQDWGRNAGLALAPLSPSAGGVQTALLPICLLISKIFHRVGHVIPVCICFRYGTDRNTLFLKLKGKLTKKSGGQPIFTPNEEMLFVIMTKAPLILIDSLPSMNQSECRLLNPCKLKGCRMHGKSKMAVFVAIMLLLPGLCDTRVASPELWPREELWRCWRVLGCER